VFLTARNRFNTLANQCIVFVYLAYCTVACTVCENSTLNLTFHISLFGLEYSLMINKSLAGLGKVGMTTDVGLSDS